MITAGIPSASAIAHACNGPAPPNATSASPRGSTPRSTVTARTALLHRRVDDGDDSRRVHPRMRERVARGGDIEPAQTGERRRGRRCGRARDRHRSPSARCPRVRSTRVRGRRPRSRVRPRARHRGRARRSNLRPRRSCGCRARAAGSGTRRPCAAGAGSGTPPRTRQTSVLVPPMSKVTASGIAARGRDRGAGAHATGRSRQQQRRRARARRRRRRRARRPTSSRAPSRRTPAMRSRYGRACRPQVRVDDGGRPCVRTRGTRVRPRSTS